MQQQQQAVKLSLNQQHMVKHLRHSFTDKTTVLSELAQNARRAGATYVAFEFNAQKNRLLCADNGQGIANFQSLFSKGESGWDSDVMHSDLPYGMGFLSVLYCAKTITIESNGMTLTCDTETALSFEDMQVTPSSRKAGTLIILDGINLDFKRIEEKLIQLAMGFPVDIRFQGESLPRPHALENKVFMETGIGQVFLHDLVIPVNETYVPTGTQGYVAYLQGVPIFNSRKHHTQNVIHLDPKQFIGRAPDRDKLVDEQAADKRITDTIQSIWRARLSNDVKTLDPVFITSHCYQLFKVWRCLDLLNSIPYVPCDALRKQDIYPIDHLEWEDRDSPVLNTQLISRNDIVSGNVKVVDTMDCRTAEESFHHHMYAYALNVLMLKDPLDSQHWLYPFLVRIEPDDVSVLLEGPVLDSDFRSCWNSFDAIFCKAVQLHGPLGIVTIKDEAFIIQGAWLNSPGYTLPIHTDNLCSGRTHQIVVVPKQEESTNAIRQLSSYIFDDTFQENDVNEDEDRFHKFLLSHRLNGEINLLSGILNDAGYLRYDCLRDKAFTLSVMNLEDGQAKLKIEMR